ncbi:uncharacterized protein LOC144115080 [Amblyomma americanum]
MARAPRSYAVAPAQSAAMRVARHSDTSKMGTHPKSSQNAEHIEIWQWNCRGYKRKAGLLKQFIATTPIRPDLICLQEVGADKAPTLAGYCTISQPLMPSVAILVAKDVTVVEHALPVPDAEHLTVEIVPNKRGRASTFVINVYMPPKPRKGDFTDLLLAASHKAQCNQFVIVGDFNAPHREWGYCDNTARGQSIVKAIHTLGLELLTNPVLPTREGNSVSRDSCPDLTLVKNVSHSKWTNLIETLGSDHCILSTPIPSSKIRKSIGPARITDWPKFRNSEFPTGHIESIQDWSAALRQAHSTATEVVQHTNETPEADRHLLKLWDQRAKLVRRWKTKKLNRQLRTRIVELTEEAQTYATQLSHQNWQQFCESLRGTLGTSRTWAILRNLIDPTKSKSEGTRTLKRISHLFPGDDAALLAALRDRYIGSATTTPSTITYQGSPNRALDAPITTAEVYAAARSCVRNTAAGADKITNAIIRNLGKDQIQDLTQYINDELWEMNIIPQEWKHSEIIVIPKPGKLPTLEALRSAPSRSRRVWASSTRG